MIGSRRSLALAAAIAALAWAPFLAHGGAQTAPAAAPPPQGLAFAVIGDSGTGKPRQFDVARAMEAAREADPFDLVLMLGDNIYGPITPETLRARFAKPYRGLLKKGVKFFASLGNHDEDGELAYERFNMDGKRFYSFSPREDLVEFFALDSDQMDAEQLDWLEKKLAASSAPWKIAFFHKPIYNTGRQHGPNLRLRALLEPIFVRHGVRLVLSGHEHIYERLKPQKGILYFVSGSAGHVNTKDIDRKDPAFAAGNDSVCHFMLFDLTPAELRYRAISASGVVIDSGSWPASGSEK